MDEHNEPPVLAKSSIPTPVDSEYNLIISASTSDTFDIPLEETNSENTLNSGLVDEKSNQQSDTDTEDRNTNMVTASVTDDSLNETFLDVTADKDQDQIPDVELDTNDSLNDSNLDNSVPDSNKRTRPDQKTEKISQFPLGRVRDIMKADPDIKIVSAECVFLVAKATEMFLQRLGKEIHTVTLRNKKKTLQKRDLEAAISENAAFEFLEGALK